MDLFSMSRENTYSVTLVSTGITPQVQGNRMESRYGPYQRQEYDTGVLYSFW